MTKPKAPKRALHKTKGVGVTPKDRRRLFAEAYLSNNGHATNAALAAGFSAKTAASQGSRMLKNVEVRALLDNRQIETLAGMQITTARVLEETARLAFSDVSKIIDPITGKVLLPNELDEATRAAVASFEIDEYGRIKYKFWDKNTASERLFKHLNLYKEDNKGRGGPAVQVAIINLVPLQPAAGAVIDADR